MSVWLQFFFFKFDKEKNLCQLGGKLLAYKIIKWKSTKRICWRSAVINKNKKLLIVLVLMQRITIITAYKHKNNKYLHASENNKFSIKKHINIDNNCQKNTVKALK